MSGRTSPSTFRPVTPVSSIDLPTSSQINRCGKRLRKFYGGEVIPSIEDLDHAYDVVSTFRSAHAYPMLKVRYGVRSMLKTEDAGTAVSQRLKRVPRIVRKLHRMPTMQLANLEDIGGVRAVVADGPTLDRVRRRVERQWKKDFTRDPRDYIAAPKPMGYRAVHFVVVRDERAIEVQLRTKGQQQWAEAVESADARLGFNLKDGDGPAEMQTYFRLAGEMIYLAEYGRPIDGPLAVEFNIARAAVIAAGYYSS